jgi:uncharacterized protein (TIGR03437 family)
MGTGLFWPTMLALAAMFSAEGSGRRQAPFYSAASIVNAASNEVGALAPYTFATIYGTDLAYSTCVISPDDIRGGRLPTELAGVRVLIDSIPAIIYYVSPKQINLLIPSMLIPSMPGRPEPELRVAVDGRAGPAVPIELLESAPALFQLDAKTVVATRADWSVITSEAPAQPGEYVVLYATGLGNTRPEIIYGQAPQTAAPIQRLAEFQVWLGGVPLEAGRITYAGAAPGFAGLYQINLKLPEKVEDNPEIRIGLGGRISPAGLRLPVRAAENKPTWAQPGRGVPR